MWIPGPKLTQVFASRWKALFWAVSILASAYFFVPRQGGDDDGDNAQAMSMARQVMPGAGAQPEAGQSDTSQSAISPWAATSSDTAAR